MCNVSRSHVFSVTTGAALCAVLFAAPVLGKSASDRADAAKEYLPDLTIRLLTAPSWDSRQSRGGQPFGTFEMEGGIGILVAIGIGEKDSWHGEAEFGLRKTDSTSVPKLVGPIDTWTGMANGYFGFEIADKFEGYLGAGVGLALHEEDSGRDLALGYQLMAGVGYEITDEITATLGLRYFGTQAASLGRTRIEYRRPELEVGIGYEF